jgi:DNA-binding transcriptional ArsR family regulator
MSDQLSAPDEDLWALRFACSCASAAPVAADPWVAVAKDGKLANGTKELIVNALHQRPRSVTQLAALLALSPPAVHRHIAELLASELIQEAPIPPAQRRSPTERHYRPNFPVVRAADRQELQPMLVDLAETFAGAFRARRDDLANAFARTGFSSRGQPFEALLHYLYAAATRLARERLEITGDLPPWPEHGDGSHWVWWGEEPAEELAETEVRVGRRK